jgi:hypothetical protein
MSSHNRKILYFIDLCAAHPQDKNYLNNVKIVLSPPYCISILQPPDQGIIRSFKQYYHKQHLRKTISVIHHKLLHDATFIKINILDAQHFTEES